MRAIAVIGANFGDEAKGKMVDYFCSQSPSLVVRFNGGAQAGHTVVCPDGRRHVFHHFGAGTFAGAATFLSRFFIVNPLLWEKERRQLAALGAAEQQLLIDPDALLTTPLDMLVNQEIEQARGAHRHGSCGIGINETVDRCDGELRTTAAHLGRPRELRSLLSGIAERALVRLESLGVVPSPLCLDLVRSDGLIEKYVRACEALCTNCRLVQVDALQGMGRVVFEGAQGLLLDEQHRFFPHVTRSRTGLTNVSTLAQELGLRELEAVYVTRSYMTRHGAGLFPSEDPAMRFPDATNLPNPWQGTLRFGRLDVDLLAESIQADLAGKSRLAVEPSLAMTCLDQLQTDPFVVAKQCRIKLRYTSCGSTREHVMATP
jgi:adenylosuccinate synthase